MRRTRRTRSVGAPRFRGAPFRDEKDAALPHHPTRRGDAAARRSRVRCGRSAGACVPRASARLGVAWGGRGLLRGHVLVCGPTAAVLRVRALACGPTAARLRVAALAYAPPAAAARLPTAARSAATLRPSASGAALGPHAPAVCLRRRARPRPLRRPGLSRLPRMARYGPRHSRPTAPRPPLPRLRRRRFRRRATRGVVGQVTRARCRLPPAIRVRLGTSLRPRAFQPNPRRIPGARRPCAGEDPRPRRRTRYGLVSSSRRASIILRPR